MAGLVWFSKLEHRDMTEQNFKAGAHYSADGYFSPVDIDAISLVNSPP